MPQWPPWPTRPPSARTKAARAPPCGGCHELQRSAGGRDLRDGARGLRTRGGETDNGLGARQVRNADAQATLALRVLRVHHERRPRVAVFALGPRRLRVCRGGPPRRPWRRTHPAPGFRGFPSRPVPPLRPPPLPRRGGGLPFPLAPLLLYRRAGQGHPSENSHPGKNQTRNSPGRNSLPLGPRGPFASLGAACGPGARGHRRPPPSCL